MLQENEVTSERPAEEQSPDHVVIEMGDVGAPGVPEKPEMSAFSKNILTFAGGTVAFILILGGGYQFAFSEETNKGIDIGEAVEDLASAPMVEYAVLPPVLPPVPELPTEEEVLAQNAEDEPTSIMGKIWNFVTKPYVWGTAAVAGALAAGWYFKEDLGEWFGPMLAKLKGMVGMGGTQTVGAIATGTVALAQVAGKYLDPIQGTQIVRYTGGEGNGTRPQKGDVVDVQYAGYLMDKNGKKIESTKFDSGTIDFKVGANRVIPGWEDAIEKISEGETATLKIPSDLAYGPRGSGSAIPGDSDLYFDITLLSIMSENPEFKKHQ